MFFSPISLIYRADTNINQYIINNTQQNIIQYGQNYLINKIGLQQIIINGLMKIGFSFKLSLIIFTFLF